MPTKTRDEMNEGKPFVLQRHEGGYRRVYDGLPPDRVVYVKGIPWVIFNHVD